MNKPPGMNTHAPSPYAGEGLYDWLRHREPRWAGLAIIHRLDKETSGILAFSKTRIASQSLTEQFTRREVRKKYVLLTDRRPSRHVLTARTKLARFGAKYGSTGATGVGELAETRFVVKGPAPGRPATTLIEAAPLTGRTHQIRVHAAENGFPVLGDATYGGTPASRVCLHAFELGFKHPTSGTEVTFYAPADFEADSRASLRGALVDAGETNGYRILHGASDGRPGWFIDRLGDYLLSQSPRTLDPKQIDELTSLAHLNRSRGAYHKILSRQARGAATRDPSPHLMLGEPAPARFTVRENGVRFELSFDEGYSVGLFLDQRDNRRRLLTRHIAAEFPLTSGARSELLNTFAYTCGFSVCAAKAVFATTSLDLSRKYLDWGKSNFRLNQLDPVAHDFIYGDTFDWLRRLKKKGRSFDIVLLDPPTFSQSKESGAFRTERDYGKLVSVALPLIAKGGLLFASANTAGWPAEEFLGIIEKAVSSSNRKILRKFYAPQPPDFPISRSEPAYLKTVWLQID
ncbi:MAG: class I SAM-dependent methyltransferase [Limisphaerales bacterium]